MRLTPLWAMAVTCLHLQPTVAAADHWDLQYFYDKNDSTLAFTDLQFPSPRRGMALGVVAEQNRRKPVLAVTSDGGANWELLPLRETGASLFFLDEANGWLVGHKGRISKTTDGGRTWTEILQPDRKAQTLRVFFREATRGFALCTLKKVFSTEDGGKTWQLVTTSRSPDVPDDQTSYTAVAFEQHTGLITGWSRNPEGRRRIDPTSAFPLPAVLHPTDAILMISRDGGQKWSYSLLRKLGQIERVALSSSGAAMLLLLHPDSLSLGSEIIGFDLKTARGKPIYGDPTVFVSDIGFAGPSRALAVAVDQEGRTPWPVIPARLKVLRSIDGGKWTEMPVDYRAEARRAVLAALDAAHVWIATDTGMILKLVTDQP